MNAVEVEKALRRRAGKRKAAGSRRFFKTGNGQYGEGDKFLGVVVPETREVARKFRSLPLEECVELLDSEWHEVRLCALLIMGDAFARGDERLRQEVYRTYLGHAHRVNNWDLVDLSAPNIVGEYLRAHTHERKRLRVLARSRKLWERRIAMVSTYALIRAGESEDALAIATLLLTDTHDLMHKAVGWMLREVGKRVSREDLRKFLDEHAAVMPRTALRYALEHFDTKERSYYMNMKSRGSLLVTLRDRKQSPPRRKAKIETLK